MTEKDINNFKPLGFTVLVKKEKEDEKTSSGIILTESPSTKEDKGVVVSTGTDVKLVKKGDNILLGQGSKYRDFPNNEDYLLVLEEYVVGVFEPESDKE